MVITLIHTRYKALGGICMYTSYIYKQKIPKSIFNTQKICINKRESMMRAHVTRKHYTYKYSRHCTQGAKQKYSQHCILCGSCWIMSSVKYSQVQSVKYGKHCTFKLVLSEHTHNLISNQERTSATRQQFDKPNQGRYT